MDELARPGARPSTAPTSERYAAEALATHLGLELQVVEVRDDAFIGLLENPPGIPGTLSPTRLTRLPSSRFRS